MLALQGLHQRLGGLDRRWQLVGVQPMRYEECSAPLVSRCHIFLPLSPHFSHLFTPHPSPLCLVLIKSFSRYACSLDGAGHRLDSARRPELTRGSVDFLVSQDYCVRPPQEPIFVFAIDVSRYAIQCGATIAAIRAVKNSIAVLAGLAEEGDDQGGPGTSFPPRGVMQAEHVRVGIFAFDSTHTYFYQIRRQAAEPIRILVSHASEPTAALPPAAWLLPLATQMEDLLLLLERIPEMLPDATAGGGAPASDTSGGSAPAYPPPSSGGMPGPPKSGALPGPATAAANAAAVAAAASASAAAAAASRHAETAVAGSCPAAAIKTAQLALETLGGRVVVLTPCTPSTGQPRIHVRERAGMYGTDAELNLYGDVAQAAGQSKDKEERQALEDFVELAQACARSIVCVDVLLCLGDDAAFRDTALLAELCDTTGGSLHCLTGSLLLAANAFRVQQQLVHILRTVAGSEAVIKLRCSVGVRLDRFIGKGFRPPGSAALGELELAGLDRDLTICGMLRFDAALKDEDKVHVQLAVLHTTPSRQRLVRVHNLTLSASSNPTIIFRNADLDCVTAVALKQAVEKGLRVPLGHKEGPRAFLTDLAIEILYRYRINCSAQSPRGQLILPESLKLFPLYALGMQKHPAFLENTEGGAAVGGRNLPVRAQERAFELRRLQALPVHACINAIYPRIFRIDKVPKDTSGGSGGGSFEGERNDLSGTSGEDGAVEVDIVPPPLSKPLSAETLQSDAVFLLEDSTALYVYVGRNVSQAKLEVSHGGVISVLCDFFLTAILFFVPTSHLLSSGMVRHPRAHSTQRAELQRGLGHGAPHDRHCGRAAGPQSAQAGAACRVGG